jgi:GTP-binding protein
MRVLARFLVAASHVRHFPAPTVPEIAFLGRSNVGKSSVINSLVGSKLAHTSSTPGRTQTINFFEVRWPGQPRAELIFADLPGYGYSRVPREISAEWPGFIEPYLKDRPSLALCVALIDSRIPLQQSDLQLMQFLEEIQRPYLVVATKSDRLSGNQMHNALQQLTRQLPSARLLRYSARTGEGRDQLWRALRAVGRTAESQNSALPETGS